MSKRLEVLKNSLLKKEAEFSSKLQSHFDAVKAANGQPLNDKRNGASTLKMWDRQNESLRSLQKSIDKTKEAIEKELDKMAAVEIQNETTPEIILELVKEGVLTQWRKHPSTFFVKGVEKARIVLLKGGEVGCKHLSELKDPDQYKTFAQTFNKILKAQRDKQTKG